MRPLNQEDLEIMKDWIESSKLDNHHPSYTSTYELGGLARNYWPIVIKALEEAWDKIKQAENQDAMCWDNNNSSQCPCELIKGHEGNHYSSWGVTWTSSQDEKK